MMSLILQDITPLLYPDLMNDNKFVVDLLRIQVKAIKENLPPHTNYYTYLTMYKKKSWMEKSLESMSNLLSHEETAVKSLEKIKNDGCTAVQTNEPRLPESKKRRTGYFGAERGRGTSHTARPPA